MRHRADHNKKATVEALRKIGVQVEIIERPLDLLICYRGETSLAEVKKSEKEKFTPAQVKFLATWKGRIYIFYGPDQALDLVRQLPDPIDSGPNAFGKIARAD